MPANPLLPPQPPRSGYQYTNQDIQNLWVQNGGDPATAGTAAAVALAESSGYQWNYNPNDPNGGSVGLFQINGIHGDQATYDLNKNVQAAIALSNDGTNWKPWGAYTDGSYQKHLDPSVTPTVTPTGQPAPGGQVAVIGTAVQPGQGNGQVAGQPVSGAAQTAQILNNAMPPAGAAEPIVTALQIADDSLIETAWYDDTSLVTGNSRIRKTVQPVSFKIYLSQQKTGEYLKNPKDNKTPIVLQLNTGLQTFELQSKHVYTRTPSRTGQHVTFWGMQPDLITGTGSTGVFMNQYGLTDWFSIASIPSDVTALVAQAFTTGKGKTVGDYAQDLTLVAQPNAMRVAAQDCFVEFLKMFQMNGNVWFHNPNYAGYHTGQQQTGDSAWTNWSRQTGLNAFQQNARNNDVFSRGWVAMEFKNNVYLGYFKALSWNQDADKPFQWTFNFTFQVERTFTALYIPTPLTPAEQGLNQYGVPLSEHVIGNSSG